MNAVVVKPSTSTDGLLDPGSLLYRNCAVSSAHDVEDSSHCWPGQLPPTPKPSAAMTSREPAMVRIGAVSSTAGGVLAPTKALTDMRRSRYSCQSCAPNLMHMGQSASTPAVWRVAETAAAPPASDSGAVSAGWQVGQPVSLVTVVTSPNVPSTVFSGAPPPSNACSAPSTTTKYTPRASVTERADATASAGDCGHDSEPSSFSASSVGVAHVGHASYTRRYVSKSVEAWHVVIVSVARVSSCRRYTTSPAPHPTTSSAPALEATTVSPAQSSVPSA
mmetsp:Transcript_20051/g.70903  ORF Transcript_20051/g.70903 Transcript_20051/m.70903 type:complete len:277 (+) Transcript_20051:1350-2180(+)